MKGRGYVKYHDFYLLGICWQGVKLIDVVDIFYLFFLIVVKQAREGTGRT